MGSKTTASGSAEYYVGRRMAVIGRYLIVNKVSGIWIVCSEYSRFVSHSWYNEWLDEYGFEYPLIQYGKNLRKFEL